ncbi:hypothetical protein LGH82_29550 [Mesorhizobium sp. PAMC28654]|uniref:hypothetical protein n=1 Tax=Mesorhizobium sp. PAMC28654 TaxID=2880934 RepID=UPI001D0A6B4E|nr:hypothetical protein [Mesorhizobium sp. PAMC28654]UDL89171.1 hypothetical protein LGH82_29550 [Mesorhizobium sp. PAMC28654]
MQLDAKTIRTRVAEELRARLGERWFKPDSTKLLVASANNLTDFSVEFDCYAERRYGDYDCSLVAVLRWKKFAKLFRELAGWYNIKFEGSAPPNGKVFARVAFDGIHGDFALPSRAAFWVASEQDLDEFITQCVNDLDGKVGDWIQGWFTWPSALQVMDGNQRLCGAWRNIAYYCLMEQVHGHEAACNWVRGIDATGWPQWLAAQVEYLQLRICGVGAAQA